MKQALGFEVRGQGDLVYKLKKSLYRLKQAPGAWKKMIDSFLIKLSFNKGTSYHKVLMPHQTTRVEARIYGYS